MASNRSSINLTLAPVVTMKIHCSSKLGSANQVVSSATQSSHHHSDSSPLCRVSDADHKYAEKVDMEFNKLIECIEEKMSDNDDDTDDDDIAGVLDEKSDCLVSKGVKEIEESVPVTTWLTNKATMDCKVGHRFLTGERRIFSERIEETKKEKEGDEEGEDWQNKSKNSKNTATISGLMVNRQVKRFYHEKPLNNGRIDCNPEMVFTQNTSTQDLTQNRLIHFPSTSNQLECPASPSLIIINSGDEIKMTNNHDKCNSETRGKGAATTVSTVSINSVSACSFSTKAITTGVSAAASSTAIVMTTDQYTKSAHEKLSRVSVETWSCLSPIFSSDVEFRNHPAFSPIRSLESLSSLLSPSIVSKGPTNTTDIIPKVFTLKNSSSNIGDIISTPRDVLNPENPFRTTIQRPELQVIVPDATNCIIDNNNNNNNIYKDESVTEDVEQHPILHEKPLSYSSSISLFTSGTLDVTNEGSSGLIFPPFCCTLSPNLATIPPAHQKSAVNFNSPPQRQSVQVRFHGPMTHTLVPKVKQDPFPHSLTGLVNKTTETINNGNKSASNCTTSCVVNTTKTTTTTTTTTATIVLTGSKERELDIATSTTTTTTSTFPTSIELGGGFSLQGDCDRNSGGSVGGSGGGGGVGDDDDEECIGSTINYSPNTNCYFCKTPVTDLDKSARLYGSSQDGNYHSVNKNNDKTKKKKEFSKKGPVPQEYQTPKKSMMQKSSVDLYLENAWSPMDATLKEKKPRVRNMHTSGWKVRICFFYFLSFTHTHSHTHARTNTHTHTHTHTHVYMNIYIYI